MKVEIITQILENYNCSEEGEPRWKPKGGSTFLVEGASLKEVKEKVVKLLDYEDSTFCEYVIEVNEVADDYESDMVRVQREFFEQYGEDEVRLDREIIKGRMSSEGKEQWFVMQGMIATKDDPLGEKTRTIVPLDKNYMSRYCC